MYREIKSMAERSVEQFVKIMEQFKKLLAMMNDASKAYLAQLERDIENATAETRANIEATKRDVEKKMREMKEVAESIGDVLNTPGSMISGFCDGVTMAGGGVLDSLFDAGRGFVDAFEDIFTGRRKRSSCEPPNIIDVPDLDLSAFDGISLDALKNIVRDLNPNLDLIDMDFDMLAAEIDSSSIRKIRDTLQGIFMHAFESTKIIARWASKIFYISIILIIYDAYVYVGSFYKDDAFDNMTINHSFKEICEKEKKPKVTPMRCWELKEKYHLAVSMILSKKETISLVTESIPSLCAAIVISGILLMDYLFAVTLEAFKEHASFGITFPGMEQGISFGSTLKEATGQSLSNTIRIDGFDLSTDKCLPSPQRTNNSSIWPIFAIIIAALLSCVIEAYFSRLRQIICNAYYPKRAQERAIYLHKKIMSGRRTRQLQLGLILHREMSCKERSAEFSPFQQVWRLFSTQKGPTTLKTCLGCKEPLKEDTSSAYTFRHNGEKVSAEICSDCAKEPNE
ncbi:E3 ubiquitin-protein ligase DCST1-like [Bolinopsis microptera]|uniref:E3 ubiquitin-protein ligase DCST1-like n=1 Tax=Bolinopsis microptera TaxID=2820187 RepID=UPI00307AD464